MAVLRTSPKIPENLTFKPQELIQLALACTGYFSIKLFTNAKQNKALFALKLNKKKKKKEKPEIKKLVGS